MFLCSKLTLTETKFLGSNLMLMARQTLTCNQVAYYLLLIFYWIEFLHQITRFFYAVRSSSPPAPGEPSVAPHPKSYMEASTFVVPLFLRNSYSCNWKFMCVYACLIHAACSHFLGYLIFVFFFWG